MVRTWLGLRDDGTPKFRILRSNSDDNRSALPYMEDEFEMYKRVLHHEEAREDPVDEHNHAMNCLEYFAHDPQSRYHKPTGPSGPDDSISDAIRHLMSDEKSRRQGETLILGPGPGVPARN